MRVIPAPPCKWILQGGDFCFAYRRVGDSPDRGNICEADKRVPVFGENPCPPDQIRKFVQTNGGGKVSPAGSVGASAYFRMQRSPPETRTPPYRESNSSCAM